MKKILSLMLVIMLVMSLAGCGVKAKLEQKAGEAIAEKMIEGAGEGKVDLDLDGDKVVIKGEDGEKMTFGSTEWPKSKLANSIPEFKKGNIVSVMEIDDSLFISFEEVSEKNFEEYMAKIKNDFTEESYEMKQEGSMVYGATNSKGIAISLTYTDENSFSITLAQAEE